MRKQYSEGYRFVVIDQSNCVREYLKEYSGYEPNWGTAVYQIKPNGTVGQYVRQNWDSSG